MTDTSRPVAPSSLTVHPSSFPQVSVLVAVRNEAPHLHRCLAALAAQTWPRECLEVIVADGCSEDGSAAVARRHAGELTLTVIDNPDRITPAGFNRALAAARGEVIVILGARALVAPDFVEQSVAALQATGADAAGGVVESVPPAGADGPAARAVALALRSPFGVGGARYRYATTGGWVDTVNYGAYRREVFARIGGFDETMTWVEDDEFNYRLRAAGGRLWLEPAIHSRYIARPSLPALWRQQFRWGFNKPRVARRHPAQMRPRHAVPAVFVATVLAGAAAAPRLRAARWLLGGVLSTYALAASAAAALLLLRTGTPRSVAGQPATPPPEPSRSDRHAATMAGAADAAAVATTGGRSPAGHSATTTGAADAAAARHGGGAGRGRPATMRRLRESAAAVACLPLAFATMHLAYGSGMVLGLAWLPFSGRRSAGLPARAATPEITAERSCHA